MPDPGGGPGTDPPDDTGPSEEEEVVQDLTVGPGPDENVDIYRQKVIDHFRAVGRAEEKLKCLKAEHKNFKTKYFQAWSKKRSAMKPELLEMEEKVKKQSLLLEKLKDKSGAFAEKCKNERRFASQTSVDQRQSHVTDNPGPSASAPLPPCKAGESPAATTQGVEGKHGTLQCIQQMESPLRADGSAGEALEVDVESQKGRRPALVEKSQCTVQPPSNMSAPPAVVSGVPAKVDGVPAVVTAGTCGSTTKMAASSKEPVSASPGLIDAGGGGEQHSAACGVEAAMEVSCTDLPVSGLEQCCLSDSPVPMEKSLPGGEVCEGATVSLDTAGTMNVPGNNNNNSIDEAMDVVGGGEGVNNDISPPAQQRKDSSAKRTAGPSAGRSVNTGSYAAVLGSRTKEGGGNGANVGGHNLGVFSGGMVGGYKRRNVVQLKWEGEGTPPVRGRVAELILEMGFKVADIFALICPVGSLEFDLSFVKPEGLDLFWERFRGRRDLPQWNGWMPKVVSRQPLIKSVTILVRNESIPEADLIVWLRRYGEVLAPLRKVLDQHGIWTGAWTVSLKLGVQGNVVQHLPCSAFLGRDRLTIFYQGQPKVCNKCGDKGHFASTCTRKKCSLCQALDHLAKDCKDIRCNLCQKLGHPYSLCPEALHNLPGLEAELQRLDKEDEVTETLVVPPVSVAPVSVPSSDVVPESVPSMSVTSVSVPPSDVDPESVPSVSVTSVSIPPSEVVPKSVPNPSIRRSSRLAEAAGGAGLADLPTQPPVPAPRQRKRDQGNVGVLDGGGADGRGSIPHVSHSVDGDSDEEGWEKIKRKGKKKRKARKPVVRSKRGSPW